MDAPTQAQIDAARTELDGAVIRTPVLPLSSDRWRGQLPKAASVTVKLELFQQTGSFKARGVLLGARRLDAAQREAGVAAVSGGNHALAVAWAAQQAGIHARVAMPKTVDPLRSDGCRAMGAEVSLHEDVFAAMDEMDRLVREDGRTPLHPFEGEHMTLGAATCGAEYLEQAPKVDTFVIPVGGGGLISGMARAIKLARPDAQVIGVEPVGADSLTRSLASGRPERLGKVDTIADSLGAPYAMPYSLALARAHVDRMVQVTDDQMREGMRLYMDDLRILAEPACAASLAAIRGPLADDLEGRHVGIIACGSNISVDRWRRLLEPA